MFCHLVIYTHVSDKFYVSNRIASQNKLNSSIFLCFQFSYISRIAKRDVSHSHPLKNIINKNNNKIRLFVMQSEMYVCRKNRHTYLESFKNVWIFFFCFCFCFEKVIHNTFTSISSENVVVVKFFNVCLQN